MSDFIERSKHAGMTAAVESHFGTAKKRTMPGDADGKSFASYGDSQYNPTTGAKGWDDPDGDDVAGGYKGGGSKFGYNYKPYAGHRTK
jgi:hypothetical protein